MDQSQPTQIQETGAGAVTGATSVSPGLPGKVTGSRGATHNSTLTVQTLLVPPLTWEALMEKR